MSRSSERPLLEVFDQNILLWILVVLLLKFAHCIWNPSSAWHCGWVQLVADPSVNAEQCRAAVTSL